MSGKCLLVAIIIAAFSAQSALSTVNFTFDHEIAFPESLGIDSRTNFEFSDLNGDGSDEIIIENRTCIASYSTTENQIIDYFKKKSDTIPRKYTYGHLDGDSLLDFMEVFLPMDSFIDIFQYVDIGNRDYRPRAVATIFLSSNAFIPLDTIVLVNMPLPVPDRSCYTVQLTRDLFLKDADSDGTQEAYFQLRIRYISALGPSYTTQLLFRNYIYPVGDDSAQQIDRLPKYRTLDYMLYDDTAFVSVAVRDTQNYFHADLFGGGSWIYDDQWSKIQIWDSDTLTSSLPIAFKNSCVFYGADPRKFNKALILRSSIHNFVENSPRYEIITEEFQSFLGYALHASNSERCSTITYNLVCYDLSSPDTLTEIWSRVYDEDPGINFIFADTGFAHRFFIYGNGRLYLRNGENGDVIDSSDVIGAENMIAYQPSDQGDRTFAIFQDGSALEYYTFDISTSVRENEPPVLPAAFVLGQPYPNPYNSQLTIPVRINRRLYLTVDAYNVLGRKVATVFADEIAPGETEINWNCENISSGIYFIRATTSTKESCTSKAVLLK
jgi:hypothetical protein